MATTKVHLTDLHFEHKLWKLRFDFYTDEMRIYESRLQEISSRNSSVDIKKQVDHFANQFYIQDIEQTKIRQEIDRHEALLVSNVKENPTASDHRLFDDHDVLREKVLIHDGIFENLKKEFIRFCEVTC